MSYWDAPRIHFTGRFQADPSTVNNEAAHYDTRDFDREQMWKPFGSPDGSRDPQNWNPYGTGAWRLVDCTITRVVYGDGTDATTPADDPLVGTSLETNRDRVTAKLVDLDPQQQMCSEVWGLEVGLGLPESPGIVQTRFEPAPFADLWLRCQPPPKRSGSAYLSAVYQSRLDVTDLGAPGGSRLLQELARHVGTDRAPLSIRFTVDGYDGDPSSPDFTFGRITGTIGPLARGEPATYAPDARLLVDSPPELGVAAMKGVGSAPEAAPEPQAATVPAWNRVPFRLVSHPKADGSGTLQVDLGNSVPTATPAGAPQVPDGTVVQMGIDGNDGFAVLAELDWSQASYEACAGIQSFSLDATAFGLAANAPLTLRVQETGQVLLREHPDGACLWAEPLVHRLYPGSTYADQHPVRPVEVLATRFGRPASGEKVAVGFQTDARFGYDPDAPPSSNNPFPPGVPESALSFPTGLVTDDSGRATVPLIASDPGTPRAFHGESANRVDGQVYAVGFEWPSAGYTGKSNPLPFASILVWSHAEVPDEPTWQDIQPTMLQYANLYPVMSRILDLGNEASARQHLGALRLAFGLPVSDPNSMPVTRDLSPALRTTILKWLDAQASPAVEAAEASVRVRAVRRTLREGTA